MWFTLSVHICACNVCHYKNFKLNKKYLNSLLLITLVINSGSTAIVEHEVLITNEPGNYIFSDFVIKV